MRVKLEKGDKIKPGSESCPPFSNGKEVRVKPSEV